MTLFLYIVAGFLFLVGLSSIVSIFFGIIPPLPSTPKMVHLLIEKIKQYDSEGKAIADIGSGYGSVVFALSRAFPTRQIVGYEISFFPRIISRFLALILGRKNIHFRGGDGFKVILHDKKITSAYAYLSNTQAYQKKFLHLYKHFDGTLFLNTYTHTDIVATEVVKKVDVFGNKLYIYVRAKKSSPQTKDE